MKEIKAVIRPQRLARLREAVRRIPDFPGMTITKAEGSGYHPEKVADHSIKSELTDYSAKVRIEIVSPDDMVGRLVAIIHEATHTGRAGDGVVWVTPVESFERLRLPLSEVD
jgi:nitrogen regulatory protein P-II 1